MSSLGKLTRELNKLINETYKLYESPMYRSLKATFKDFYNYVIENPKCKKGYYQIGNIRIPSDTIIHSYTKHKTTIEEWEDYFNNFFNIINADISRKTLFSNPSKIYLLHVKGKYDYGIALQDMNNVILTFFKDHPNSIDNWIKTDSARVPTSQLLAPVTSKGSSVTISGQNPINIINDLKIKIKSFNEDYTEEPDAFEYYSEISMDNELQNNLDKQMKNKETLLLRLYNYLKNKSWCNNISIVNNELSFTVAGDGTSLFAFHRWYGQSKILKFFKIRQYQGEENSIEVFIS